ncbi:hypothetical protein OO014_14285 [Intrasporangium calvum]|uniref:Peptidase S11 D-alanyl-D-alanine carboxypeptidase A N-terminal domain-containing protein n=1 Tax=Intrasporangium calvum TaxID=53358 RepID=A0ABT5GK10_9MICO|nr:hypothetical protein [Intrasporangium calvum]MDC5698424.1 hypothetical protein [Intrasporangium calvum]
MSPTCGDRVGPRSVRRASRRSAPVAAAMAVVATLAAALVAGAAAQASVVRPSEGRTPACEEWQTITQVPVPGVARPSSGSATGTPKPRTTPVCRNAPPRPFPQPAWAPESVVGGPRLAATGVVVDLPPGVAPPPKVRDLAYVVADLDSGQVLAAKSPHAWLRPASTLKTLTALTLIPRLEPARRVLAGPEHEAANGTRVGILAGNRYPVGKLFDALLLTSANDAAYLLADAAGGYDATVALMNETAVGLGAHDTVVVDPSGLDEEGQRSSAYDLALVGRAAMSIPEFRRYVVKPHVMFPGGKNKATGTVYPAFQIQNINDLLRHYAGAVGIKPGRTNRAQHTFIGAATRDGRTLIVTQLGSTTGDWEDTAALLDWGFAHADAVAPVGVLVEPGQAPPPSRAASTPATPSTMPSGAADAVVAPAPSASGPAPGGAASGPVAERTAAGVAAWAVTALAAAVVLGLLLIARRHGWRRSSRSRELR